MGAGYFLKTAQDSINRVSWNRHEMKYLISESQAARIRRFIEPYVLLDRHSEFKPNNAYPIVSLYLDSDNMQLCRESIEGKKNRFKLRVRNYVDNPDYPLFFEIKRRVGTIIIKSRARIMKASMMPLLNGTLAPPTDTDIEDENLKQFLLYADTINAGPAIKVRYLRQAFESIADDRVRITFDRDLSCMVTSVPEVQLNGPGWQKLPISGVILEIKFTGSYPAWLDSLTKCFSLRKQSLSKYVNCVNQACILGFRNPRRKIIEYGSDLASPRWASVGGR